MSQRKRWTLIGLGIIVIEVLVLWRLRVINLQKCEEAVEKSNFYYLVDPCKDWR
jgi:hypothetical protein